MFGEKNMFHVNIWNHPTETTTKNWLCQVPGMIYNASKVERFAIGWVRERSIGNTKFQTFWTKKNSQKREKKKKGRKKKNKNRTQNRTATIPWQKLPSFSNVSLNMFAKRCKPRRLPGEGTIAKAMSQSALIEALKNGVGVVGQAITYTFDLRHPWKTHTFGPSDCSLWVVPLLSNSGK